MRHCQACEIGNRLLSVGCTVCVQMYVSNESIILCDFWVLLSHHSKQLHVFDLAELDGLPDPTHIRT